MGGRFISISNLNLKVFQTLGQGSFGLHVAQLIFQRRILAVELGHLHVVLLLVLSVKRRVLHCFLLLVLGDLNSLENASDDIQTVPNRIGNLRRASVS